MTKINIPMMCPECKAEYILSVEPEDFMDYQNRKGSVGVLMPYLNRDEKELLISGMCDKCFNAMYYAEI